MSKRSGKLNSSESWWGGTSTGVLNEDQGLGMFGILSGFSETLRTDNQKLQDDYSISPIPKISKQK